MMPRQPDYASRYVSALETGSTLHLGSYFGNLSLCMDSQIRNPRNCFLFVADLHYRAQSLDERDLHRRNVSLIRDFLALGINPDFTVLYQQSDIPEVLELMWLLACHTPMRSVIGAEDHKSVANPMVAQSLYPVLMAADVLGIRASIVTVGPDEDAHVRQAQDIAEAINKVCNYPLVPLPKRDGRANKYITGTDGARMSSRSNNIIPLFAEESDVFHVIDSIPEKRLKKKDPIDANEDATFKLLANFLSHDEWRDVVAQCASADMDYADGKALLKKKFLEKFSDAREARRRYEDEFSRITDVLDAGKQRVRREIRETILRVRDAMQANG